MYILPIIYKDRINTEIQKLLDENIIGEVDFTSIDVSFFKRFPYLTASVNSIKIRGNEVLVPETNDLLTAKEFSLGINLMDLLDSTISFNRVYLKEPIVNLEVDSLGNANYLIFKPSNNESSNNPFSLEVDLLKIDKGFVRYNDASAKFYFKGNNLNYVGSGKMEEVLFSLNSTLDILSFELSYDNVYYVKEKPIYADLVTLINTESLTFEFQKNDLRIKDLLVNFVGQFGFVQGGYDMLFDIKAKEVDLAALLSVIPPEYQKWLDSTNFAGVVNGHVNLSGKFISLDTIRPTLDFNLKLINAKIQHKGVVDALENLNLDFHFKMPSLNLEKSIVDIHNLNFTIADKKSQLELHTVGFTEPTISSNLNINTDLALLHNALGISDYDFKGDFAISGTIDGKFEKGIKTTQTIRNVKHDTVIVSIPKMAIRGGLKNGYFKMATLPKALENINFDFSVLGETARYQDIKVDMTDINFTAMDNFIRGHFKLKNLSNFDIDTQIAADIDLDKIKEFLPMSDDVIMKGKIQVDGKINGSYEPKRKRFPIINTEIKLLDGELQFKRLPELPVENIQIHTVINSSRGSFSDLSIKVLPIQFTIANEPFQLSASLFNLNNLNYNIQSKGILNIGDLYKLFRIDGVDVKGKIIASIFLRGLQSDALNGEYDKLKNRGRFEIENIQIASELYPYPLLIKKGVFKFYKEKMQFDEFVATYGSSQINMKGYLTNVVDYILKNDTLKGKFTFDSKFVNVDDFMMFGNTSKDGIPSASGSGVIQVPGNLNLKFEASAKKINYTTYKITDFTGELAINQGQIKLNNTNFELIGTKVNMSGSYKPLGYKSGEFNYMIGASNFDIQRAYKEIDLFREMVSMAKDAYGIVSLNYTLAGKLNKDMVPILPSLIGGGSLKLDDIQFKGFKLLGAIAKETDAESLEDGKLSDVEIRSSVEDNVLTIERTKMKMAGFRPRFEGQVSLDGEMNIGFRLGLPPLGIIGIPLKINGTPDNFRIKLGKYKPSEVLGRPSDDDYEDDEDHSEVEEDVNNASIETKDESEK